VGDHQLRRVRRVNKALKNGADINNISFSTVMVGSGAFYPPCRN